MLVIVAGCRNPQADALIAEQMREMGDELNNASQETAVMHEQIDSLRIVVARQDTLLRQLAEWRAAGATTLNETTKY